jgi:hypothetical protein
VSNFFGRNKRVTLAIKRKILWCRSHYQTNAYQTETWKFQRLGLILQQAQFIRDDDHVLYTICLKNEEAERLNNWTAHHEDLPAREMSHYRGRCFRAPIWSLRHIESHWIGVDKPDIYIRDFAIWAADLLRTGHLTDIPMLEFLPQYAGIKIKLQKAQTDSLRRAADRADADSDATEDAYDSDNAGGHTAPRGHGARANNAGGDDDGYDVEMTDAGDDSDADDSASDGGAGNAGVVRGPKPVVKPTLGAALADPFRRAADLVRQASDLVAGYVGELPRDWVVTRSVDELDEMLVYVANIGGMAKGLKAQYEQYE